MHYNIIQCIFARNKKKFIIHVCNWLSVKAVELVNFDFEKLSMLRDVPDVDKIPSIFTVTDRWSINNQ